MHMSGKFRPSRRAMLKVGLAGAAGFASPAILSVSPRAENGPVKIGMPVALTGPLGSVGQQTKRGAEFWAKLQNAKGGVLGRPIELLIEDRAATTIAHPTNVAFKGADRLYTANLGRWHITEIDLSGLG